MGTVPLKMMENHVNCIQELNALSFGIIRNVSRVLHLVRNDLSILRFVREMYLDNLRKQRLEDGDIFFLVMLEAVC